jgi:hypothetical protein
MARSSDCRTNGGWGRAGSPGRLGDLALELDVGGVDGVGECQVLTRSITASGGLFVRKLGEPRQQKIERGVLLVKVSLVMNVGDDARGEARHCRALRGKERRTSGGNRPSGEPPAGASPA